MYMVLAQRGGAEKQPGPEAVALNSSLVLAHAPPAVASVGDLRTSL
eukprot:CAMPEP_0178419530 /NCGR_PEP_ID=MMETSP0689_2-20121128/25659_1 /TAXON_ID=160604 /ORGANISM="Amphidinium massartii, Strain CS-259" /LENGTH=45 /DNA_ID= /DNA_START= /DNA_END= /DNA_ORIENTATION=